MSWTLGQCQRQKSYPTPSTLITIHVMAIAASNTDDLRAVPEGHGQL